MSENTNPTPVPAGTPIPSGNSGGTQPTTSPSGAPGGPQSTPAGSVINASTAAPIKKRVTLGAVLKLLYYVTLMFIWGRVLAWIFRPLIGYVHEDEVILFRVQKTFYTWVVILFGFLGAYLVSKEWVDPKIMSWYFNGALFFVLAASLGNLPRNPFLIVMGIIALVVALLALIGAYSDYYDPLLWIYKTFVGFDAAFDIGGAKLLCWPLLVLFVISIILARIDGKVRITYGEIEIFHFGATAESISRIGTRTKLSVDDYLEVPLGLGGGGLVTMNSEGRVVLHIKDLLCILPRWRKIRQILDVWQTREVTNSATTVAST